MELKLGIRFNLHQTQERSNRTFMELKPKVTKAILVNNKVRSNRTFMELKPRLLHDIRNFFLVLIVPLWN